MKKLLALAAVSTLALAGCGGTDEDVLETGGYNVTNVTLTSALDECDVGPGLRDAYVLQVETAGKDVTFFTDTATKPMATVDDQNAFSGTAETTLTEEGCTFKVVKTLSGTVASTTEFTATYTYHSEVVSGGAACTPEVLLFNGTSCTSTHTFTATKPAEAAAQ